MGWFEHDRSRIYFEDEGRGDPVLFLPGWSESIDEFADLRRRLAGDFRVVSADLPGSGKSGPQPREYVPTYYQDDAYSFLALLDHVDAVPAHVVGFSDGGEVALVMATRKPATVRTVVAWGAAGQLAISPDMIEAFGKMIDAPIEPLVDFSVHLKAVYGEENARAMTQSASRAWESIVETGGDISRARAPDIACPTLLITGEYDFFAAPSVVSELANAIPQGQFEEVKSAGHVLHTEHGEWLAATIASWLTSHSS